MNRKYLYPLLVIIIAILFYVNEQNYSRNNSSEKNNKNSTIAAESQNKSLSPSMSAPKVNTMELEVIQHDVKQKEDGIYIEAMCATNFPGETDLQAQFMYTNDLGDIILSEQVFSASSAAISFGPFANRSLLAPGNYKIVIFYYPTQNNPQLIDIPFMESTYIFSYKSSDEYGQFYKKQKEKAQELLSNIKKLYDVAKEKKQSFRSNATLAEWNIWLAEWERSLEAIRENDRDFYQQNIFIFLFPSMKKCIALLNLIEDTVIDYTKAIEKKKTIPSYNEKRFEQLYYETNCYFTYESVATAQDREQNLVVEFQKEWNQNKQNTQKLRIPDIYQKQDFLLRLSYFQNLHSRLKSTEDDHFISESNRWLLDFKLATYQTKNEVINSDIANYIPIMAQSLLKEWFQIAIDKNLFQLNDSLEKTKSFPNLLDEFIQKWDLESVPLVAITQSFNDLEKLLDNIGTILEEEENLYYKANDLILWESAIVERQEKNQKLAKYSNNEVIQNMTQVHSTLSIEILLFLENAKEESAQSSVLKQTISELRLKIEKQKPE